MISFPHLVCWDSAPALGGNGRQCIGGGARVEARARRGLSGSTTMSHKSSDLLQLGFPWWGQMGVRAGIGTSGCLFPRGEREFPGMKASEFRSQNLGINFPFLNFGNGISQFCSCSPLTFPCAPLSYFCIGPGTK